MGEIADMMLDGTLCQQCGVVLRNSLSDFPQTCGDCKRADVRDAHRAAGQKKVPCKTCGRLVKLAGINDHVRALHSVATGSKTK